MKRILLNHGGAKQTKATLAGMYSSQERVNHLIRGIQIEALL